MTAPHKDLAEHIALQLVDEGLVACANIFPKMISIYRWKDKVQEGEEVVLILKTRTELIERTSTRVKELHSYECPCVVALPIVGGNGDFLQWIQEQTASPTPMK